MSHHHRQITTDLNTHLTKLSIPYQTRKSLLSYGLWNEILNLIEITHQNRSGSKCFLSMGFIKNSKLYLYPEEAIYMMQSSLLQVSINPKQFLPISLNEAYGIWLNDQFLSLKHLHVYQYLTRIGFILIRHRLDRPITENKQEVSKKKSGTKRKRDEYEQELADSPRDQIENTTSICPIHSSTDCQRSWFPNYTDELPLDIKLYPRLIFPDQFSPIHIDWLPSAFNSKVSNVQLSIYQNNISTPRPSSSLIRSIDLHSHSSIYQRLSSFMSHSNPSIQSSSNISYDMYTPRKHFRKTQPDEPDYYLQIKNGNDRFNFDEIYNEQQTKSLTAVVHNGDICFYSFKSFNPLDALQLN